MKTKIIYKLDEYGFAILDSAKKIYADPRTGEFCDYEGFVNNAPDIPELKENEGAKLVNGNWEVLPDYRNAKLWNKETKEAYKIEEPEVVPDNQIYTQKDPGKVSQRFQTSYIKFDFAADYWIKDEDAEQEAKDKQRTAEIEVLLDKIDIRRLRPKEELEIDPESKEAKAVLKKLDQEKADLKAEYALLKRA